MGPQKGKDGEEKIKSIIEEYYGFTCSETAGATKGPDLYFTVGEKRVGIEIKSGKANECGQRAMKLIDGKLTLNEKEVLHQKVLGNHVPFGGRVPPFLLRKITYEEWIEEKENFKDETYIIKNSTIIADYYLAQGSHYIYFEDKGLFHTGDILLWNVPEFKCDIKVRIRCKQHSGKIPSSVQVVILCQKGSFPKSEYNFLTGKMPEKPKESLSLQELKKLCKEKGIKGYSNKKKEQLIVLLEKNVITENYSPLRYPGGKSRAIGIISEIIYSNFIDKTILLSPFFGGGSIELAFAKNNFQVYANDLFHPLYCFWSCLKKRPEKLMNKVNEILEREEITSKTFSTLREFDSKLSKLEIAGRYYIINRSSFSGATFCGGFSQEAYDKRLTQSAFDKLGETPELLSNVTFSNLDWEEFLKGHEESSKTVVYLDPPYYISNYIYGRDGDLHEAFDHQRLRNYLGTRKDWVLSYNDCEEIRKLYQGFRIIEASWSYGMNKTKKSSEIVILPKNRS